MTDSKLEISFEPELRLPDLQDAVLGVSQMRVYLEELDSLGCPVKVRVKSAFQQRPRTLSLGDIGRALERGEIHSAQLRYRFEGTAWVDTLMRTARGIRLVRLDLNEVDHGPA
jgi:hypothetical protein